MFIREKKYERHRKFEIKRVEKGLPSKCFKVKKLLYWCQTKETLRQKKKKLGVENRIKVQTRMIYNYKYGYS